MELDKTALTSKLIRYRSYLHCNGILANLSIYSISHFAFCSVDIIYGMTCGCGLRNSNKYLNATQIM